MEVVVLGVTNLQYPRNQYISISIGPVRWTYRNENTNKVSEGYNQITVRQSPPKDIIQIRERHTSRAGLLSEVLGLVSSDQTSGLDFRCRTYTNISISVP